MFDAAAGQKVRSGRCAGQALRSAARAEAERWGWAGATEQLRTYYRTVLSAPQLTAA